MKITIKIIQLLLILCWYQQAIGQINKPSSKQKAEKFDIQKLYQFKAQNKTEDTLPDGSRVGYIENSKEIQETIKAPDSGYNIVK